MPFIIAFPVVKDVGVAMVRSCEAAMACLRVDGLGELVLDVRPRWMVECTRVHGIRTIARMNMRLKSHMTAIRRGGKRAFTTSSFEIGMIGPKNSGLCITVHSLTVKTACESMSEDQYRDGDAVGAPGTSRMWIAAFSKILSPEEKTNVRNCLRKHEGDVFPRSLTKISFGVFQFGAWTAIDDAVNVLFQQPKSA